MSAGVQLPEKLLEILVCPACHSSLAIDHDARELVCTGTVCRLAFPVTDSGIPVLLIDRARQV